MSAPRASHGILSTTVRAGVGAGLAIASSLALGSAQRTFVASDGSDANVVNNCSIALPCRSFTAALGVTNANGEIVVRDSAGYGPVSISQSVTIASPAGVYAGVSVASGAGISVGGTGIRVVLRGLTINGQGGSDGIAVGASNSEVHVEGAVVSNMAGRGISASGAGTRVHVKDSELRSNGDGIYVASGARAYVDRTRMEENAGAGAVVYDDAELYVRDSVVHRNNTGIAAYTFSASAVSGRLVVDRVLISGSTYGGINVQLQGNASNRIDAVVTDATIVDNAGAGYNGINFQCFGSTSGVLTLAGTTISHHMAGYAAGMQVVGGNCLASVGGSTFTRNQTGMTGGTATLTSFGNNQFDRNGTDIFGTYTTKAPK